jgi:hypothetical protein
VPAFVRALLWIAFIVVPGGVFLLPLLLGDAALRRKKLDAQSLPRVLAKLESAPAHPIPVSPG